MSFDSSVPETLKWGSTTLGTGSGSIGWTADLTGLDFDPTYSIDAFYTEVDEAFARWTEVANIEFVEVAATSADVTFGVSLLEDESAAGLASISYSNFGDVGVITSGSVQMDLDRTWAPEGGALGLDFFAVALHEIGHILGLSHIEDDTEIMNEVIRVDDLGEKDIAAVQRLYGEAGSSDDPPPELSASTMPAEDGGSGGGPAALIFGLLAALIGFLFGGPGGAAAAIAAGRVEDEPEELPELDEDFLPEITVYEHYAFIGDDGHVHEHGCDCAHCSGEDEWDDTAFI